MTTFEPGEGIDRGERFALEIARRCDQAAAVLFAVGVVRVASGL